MPETTTRTRLEDLLRTFSGVGADYAFTDETRFGADLQLDSLDLIELSLLIDVEFGIQMDDDEVDAPENGTLGGMVAFIERKLAG